MRPIFLLILTLNVSILFGQNEKKKVSDFPIPKNIEECFSILDKTLSDEKLHIIKTYPEDSIYYHDKFRWGTDFFHAWKLYGQTEITIYFNEKGLKQIKRHEIYKTILISYHRYLNDKPINLEEQISKFQEIQKKDTEAYIERTKKDSINGVYIPMNLEECFTQINSFWSDSLKAEVKKMSEKDFRAKAHFGFGRWMRNNWGLWGGSRLEIYFNEMGIYHPDDMSGIILDSYHRQLNGKEIKLKEQIKFYQDYWNKAKAEQKKN